MTNGVCIRDPQPEAPKVRCFVRVHLTCTAMLQTPKEPESDTETHVSKGCRSFSGLTSTNHSSVSAPSPAPLALSIVLRHDILVAQTHACCRRAVGMRALMPWRRQMRKWHAGCSLRWMPRAPEMCFHKQAHEIERNKDQEDRWMHQHQGFATLRSSSQASEPPLTASAACGWGAC
eukprot:scaffold115638_cov18-Tisochrysis_lutea.AAC.1